MEAKIQAVTFDVGGTLIDPWPSVGHVYAEVAARHGWPNFIPEKLNKQFAHAWRTKRAFDYSKTAWSEVVAKTFIGLFEPGQPVPFFDALYERFAQPDAWRVHDDVRPALERLLERDLELGIVSNWDERLRPLLNALELDRYFRVVIISQEIGFTKPSPVIFEEAARKFACPAAAILHVGDGEVEDVQGARAAGLRSVRLNRQGQGAAPDVCSTLRELDAFLDEQPPG